MKADIEKIKKSLRDWPEKIWKAELAVEENRHALDMAECEYDSALHGATLRHRAAGEKDTVAKIMAEQDSIEARQKCIEAEHQYRKSSVEKNLLENQFASIRKMANLIEAEIQKLGITD